MQLECGDEIWRQETGIKELPYGEEIMIAGRTMRAQSTSVTGIRTDRFTMTKTALFLASRGNNWNSLRDGGHWQQINIRYNKCDSWSVGLFDVSCFMRGCSVFLYTFCVYSRKLVHVQ